MKRLIMATSLRMDEKLTGRLRHLAALRQPSPHWIMPEAIQQYVDRESLRQDALASWAAWKETGQHLTGRKSAPG